MYSNLNSKAPTSTSRGGFVLPQAITVTLAIQHIICQLEYTTNNEKVNATSFSPIYLPLTDMQDIIKIRGIPIDGCPDEQKKLSMKNRRLARSKALAVFLESRSSQVPYWGCVFQGTTLFCNNHPANAGKAFPIHHQILLDSVVLLAGRQVQQLFCKLLSFYHPCVLLHAYFSTFIFQIRYPATMAQVRYSNADGSLFQLLIISRTTSPQ